MVTTQDKERDAFQQKLDSLQNGASLKLTPREYPGPLQINRTVTLDGNKATLWARTGPVLTLNAPNVVLRNFRIEVTGDGEGDPQEDCAIEVLNSQGVKLENVEVRGTVVGLAGEEGAWRYPNSLAFGQLPHGQEHEILIRLYVPVACRIESRISGVDVAPHTLSAGPQEVRFKFERMAQDIILNGTVVLKTPLIQRLMSISAHILSNPNAPTPPAKDVPFWQPNDWDALKTGAAPSAPAPRSTKMRKPPASVKVDPDSERPHQTMVSQDSTPLEVPVEEWSPDMPPTPTTITVSTKSGEGKFKTIGEALKSAVPGSTINVKPGTYKEAVVIDKKIEILADGPAGSVVVEGTDQGCVKVQTMEEVALRGLILKGLASKARAQRFAVNVVLGKPVFEDCTITSDSLACVAVHGADVDPAFRNCTIQGGRSAGVLVYDGGQGQFDNCVIADHGHASVEVRQSGNPSFHKCTIKDGKEAGALIYDKGTGTFDDCEIIGHSLSGVDIRKGGNPAFKKCKIQDGKHPGVRIDGGAGSFDGCEISGNTLSGVEVRQEAKPTFRKCRIVNNKQAGVLVKKGQGAFDDCVIANNALCGVEVREGAPVLKRCDVHENGEAGVAYTEKGKGKLDQCDIHANGQANVEVRQESAPIVTGCKIHEGKQVGVLVSDSGAGVFENCDVWGNAWPGVVTMRGGNPIFKGGHIRNGQQGGFVATEEGAGKLEKVEVIGNAFAGIVLLQGSTAVVRECKINRNSDLGVWADGQAKGQVVGCDLRNNGRATEVAGRAVVMSGNRVDKK